MCTTPALTDQHVVDLKSPIIPETYVMYSGHATKTDAVAPKSFACTTYVLTEKTQVYLCKFMEET